MRRISIALALAALMVIGAASVIGGSATASPDGRNQSAAFRDGVFSGRKHAEAEREVHIATGRWSRPQDKKLFAAGYLQAYESVASERAALRRARGNQND